MVLWQPSRAGMATFACTVEGRPRGRPKSYWTGSAIIAREEVCAKLDLPSGHLQHARETPHHRQDVHPRRPPLQRLQVGALSCMPCLGWCSGPAIKAPGVATGHQRRPAGTPRVLLGSQRLSGGSPGGLPCHRRPPGRRLGKQRRRQARPSPLQDPQGHDWVNGVRS